MSDSQCAIDGCVRLQIARGWCSRHWQRWKRHGDPLAGGKERTNAALPDRFWANVDKTDGCWVWLGLLNDAGYGLIRHQGRNVRAHRIAWALDHGSVPEGMQVDHQCRNRACVRASHLRLVTNKQNAEHRDATSASGYRGVSFNKRRNKWVVQVMHNGRNHYGGYFEDLREAAEHAKAMRNELFTHNELDRKSA